MIFTNSKGQPIHSGRYLQNCDSCPCGPGCVFTPIYSSPFLMGRNGSDLITGAEINTMIVNGIELRMTWNSEELGVKPDSGTRWVSQSTFSRTAGDRLIYAQLVIRHDMVTSPFIWDFDGLEFGNYYYNYYNLFIYEYDSSGSLIHPEGYNYSARYQMVSVTDKIASGNVIRGSSQFPGLSLLIPAGNSTDGKYDFNEMIDTGSFNVFPPDFLTFDPGEVTETGLKKTGHCYYTPAYISAGVYSVTFAKNETARIGIYSPPEDDPDIECPADTVTLGPITGELDPIMTSFEVTVTITSSSRSESRSGSIISSDSEKGECVYELLYECRYDREEQKFKWNNVGITLVGWFEGNSAEEKGYVEGVVDEWNGFMLYIRVEETNRSDRCGTPVKMPDLKPCSPQNCGDPVEVDIDPIYTGFSQVDIPVIKEEFGVYLYINDLTLPVFPGGEFEFIRAVMFDKNGNQIADNLQAGSAVFLAYREKPFIIFEFKVNSFDIQQGEYTIGKVNYSICPAAATETAAMLAIMGE